MATKSKIVTLRKKELFTTTLVIAEKCDITHEAVIKLTRKFINDLNSVGLVRFQIRARLSGVHGGGDTEFAELDDYAAMLLLTYMRNSEIVARFKLNLITEFKRMREILLDPNRAKDIQNKRDAHAPMMDALLYAREKNGLKYPSREFFMHENILCNEVLTGNHGGLNEDDLDSYDLKLLKALRYHNGILAQESLNALWREAKLKEFAENYRKKHPHLKLLKS
jgi:phage regulator Rha-like protein